MEPKQLDWTKTIRTRSGSEVRLYEAEGGGDYPVHGAYRSGDSWYVAQWDLMGNYNKKIKVGLDLVNA